MCISADLELICLSSPSLALPPMDKQRRKLVHDVSSNLSLKSKSRGDGRSRFPVIHKTIRTNSYGPRTASHFDELFLASKIIARAGHIWDRRNAGKWAKGSGTRYGSASVSYADGEVVGARAPEIGEGNKGRAMLEKMGWSTGTALGASHNKGILQPVAHVVKNSRVGLG